MKVKEFIAANEGETKLLYSDPSNPYEEIIIKAVIKNGELIITDFESADYGSSKRVITFDKENTEKVFSFLMEKASRAPFLKLAMMMGYDNRTSTFLSQCDLLAITYENQLFI